jgi:hypothetical protein
MAVTLDNYTLTFSPTAGAQGNGGWPSFYSYIPEMIKGMNQYLYTFSGGNLFRHNVNDVRNNYYGLPTPTTGYNSVIKTIFNQSPLENKVFKTIELESDTAWKAEVLTDTQAIRPVEAAWFEKKEGEWFAFMRGLSTGNNFLMRSANGLGTVTTVAGVPTATTLTFPAGTEVGSIISIGDQVFATSTPATVAPVLAGVVVAPLSSTSNVVTIDTTTGTAVPLNGDFILYQKNQVAESHGLLGHYCEVTLTNSDTTATELFAIRSDIMKSYP